MYDDLVKRLRASVDGRYEKCDGCPYEEDYPCCVDCLDKMHKQAADAIEKLEHQVFLADLACKSEAAKAPRWIPVTERLPENLTSVIVHRKDGGIFTWEYFNTSPTDECWIDDSMNVYSFYDVTHWMPLPQPPKEE